jgi:hypothetical protein
VSWSGSSTAPASTASRWSPATPATCARRSTRRAASRRRRALYRAEGYLLDWQIVGPFENAGRAGHAAVYPPETTQHAAAQTFVGKLPGEPLAWRRFVHAEAPRGAFVNFADLLHPYEQATGYATVWIKDAQAGARGAAPRRGRGVQGVARRSAGRRGRHVPHADAAAGGARAAADGRVAPAADQGRQRRGAVGVLRAAQRSARGAAHGADGRRRAADDEKVVGVEPGRRERSRGTGRKGQQAALAAEPARGAGDGGRARARPTCWR